MNTQVDKKIHDLRSYLGLSLKAFGEPCTLADLRKAF